MTPPQLQISLLSLVRAGKVPAMTVGIPIIQGAAVAGTHGMGVKTPNAADVAEITAGFAAELQTANGKILTRGLLSIIVATGIVPKIILVGRTINEDGAVPNEHWSIAPAVTRSPISTSFARITCILRHQDKTAYANTLEERHSALRI